MEAQEIFNIVSRHLLTQREKSTAGDEKFGDMCMYRGPNGLKCAAGVLMTNEEVEACGEEWAWSCAITAAQLEVVDRIGHSGLVAQLQWVHDNAKPEDWKEELMKVAGVHGLNTSVLDEFEGRNAGAHGMLAKVRRILGSDLYTELASSTSNQEDSQ